MIIYCFLDLRIVENLCACPGAGWIWSRWAYDTMMTTLPHYHSVGERIENHYGQGEILEDACDDCQAVLSSSAEQQQMYVRNRKVGGADYWMMRAIQSFRAD